MKISGISKNGPRGFYTRSTIGSFPTTLRATSLRPMASPPKIKEMLRFLESKGIRPSRGTERRELVALYTKKLHEDEELQAVGQPKEKSVGRLQPPVVFVVDSTYSMKEVLDAVKESLGPSYACLALMGVHIFIVVYRDYDESSKEWEQGSIFISEILNTVEEQEAFVQEHLSTPSGGADVPESQITCFNRLLGRFPAGSILLHFTDASYHEEHHWKGVRQTKAGKREGDFCQKKGYIFNAEELGKKIRKKFTVFTIGRHDGFSHPRRCKYDLTPCLKLAYEKFGVYFGINDYTANNIADFTNKLLQNLFGLTSHEFSVVSNDFKPVVVPALFPVNLLEEIKARTPEELIEIIKILLSTEIGVKALISNPNFGKAWRRLVGYRQTFPLELKELLNQMSRWPDRLDEEGSLQLRAWINESYNSKDQIEDDLKTNWHGNLGLTFRSHLPLQGFKDVLEVVRGGGKHAKDVMKAICSMQVEPLSAEFVPGMLPLCTPSLFQYLLHLLFPGTKVGSRNAKVLAIFSLGVEGLGEKAKEYLKKTKGTWIDWGEEDGSPNVPENFSPFFFRTLNWLDGTFLTPEEILFRNKVNSLLAFRSGLHVLIDKIQVSLKRRISDIARPSNQKECSLCGVARHFTLFTEHGLCGICDFVQQGPLGRTERDLKYESLEAKDYVSGLEAKLDKFATCSQTFEGGGTCGRVYAILRPQNCNVSPKCHYCRKGVKPSEIPTVQCIRCKTLFAGHPCNVDKGDFTCSLCIVQPSNSIVEAVPIQLFQLVQENEQLKTLLGIGMIPPQKKFRELIKMVDQILVKAQSPEITSLSYCSRIILNLQETLAKCKEALTSGKSPTICSICMESGLQLEGNACGYDGCIYPLCIQCMSSWYTPPHKGGEVSDTNLRCPFCKKMPKFAKLKKVGADSRKAKKPEVWDRSMIYGWCIECNQILPAIPKECGERTAATLTNWKCGCDALSIEAKDYTETTQNCPGCGGKFEKTGGCDHLECPWCTKHFCFGCGFEGETGDEIYEHMHPNYYCPTPTN